MNAPEARYQDDIVIAGASPRQANTRFGAKTVWDIDSTDGRKFQSWDQGLGMQAANLLNQQVRVVYKEKPSRDPSYPPNLELESITPTGLAGPGAAAPAQAQPAQAAPAQAQPAQAAPVQQQPLQAPAAAQPLPAAQGSAGAGTGGGPSQEDKQSMRRSAAVKAAAALHSGLGVDAELDFWKTVEQVLTYIETGNDPIPFEAGQQQQVDSDIPY